MADQIAEKIVSTAITLAGTHPQVPALDVLDLAMQGHHGSDLDMQAEGPAFTDWLDPPSPFARLLHAAFAPDMPVDLLFAAAADVWRDRLPDGTSLADAWQARVVAPFATRYRLWGQ